MAAHLSCCRGTEYRPPHSMRAWALNPVDAVRAGGHAAAAPAVIEIGRAQDQKPSPVYRNSAVSILSPSVVTVQVSTVPLHAPDQPISSVSPDSSMVNVTEEPTG